MSAPHLALFTLLGVAISAATFQWRYLSAPDKLIYGLLWLTAAQEVTALVMSLRHGNNLPTYHIYSPAELATLTGFFLLCHHRRGIRTAILVLGASGILFSVVNTIWIQNIATPNTYFLLTEATIILLFCMLTVFDLALEEFVSPFKMTQFWIVLGMLFYWSITFAAYGMLGMPTMRNARLNIAITSVFQGANLLFYLGIATLFIVYRKLIPSGARR